MQTDVLIQKEMGKIKKEPSERMKDYYKNNAHGMYALWSRITCHSDNASDAARFSEILSIGIK